MDATQERHERAVGDEFVRWYNEGNATAYAFDRRGADPPDLVYRDGAQELKLEITGAYYDAPYATMLWKNARGRPDAADSWSGASPDGKLVDSINAALAKKCGKRTYPGGCALVVALYPDLTSVDEFADLLREIVMPPDHGFSEVYVGGLFPASSSGSTGGQHWWRLS
jgi:hypothetical protein